MKPITTSSLNGKGNAPAAILLINVLGSFILGGATAALPQTRGALLVGTGFCGAFTTFSTFAMDTVSLVQAERYAAAATYVLANNCLSIGGAAAGFAAARTVKPLLGRLAGPG